MTKPHPAPPRIARAARTALLALAALTCHPSPGYPPVDVAAWFRDPETVADRLAPARNLSAPALLDRYPAQFEPGAAHVPERAERFDLLQRNTAVHLDAKETELLARNGFVIAERRRLTTFPLAYLGFYQADLPIFISADAILHAWHRSYDTLLLKLEESALSPTLTELLDRLREALPRAPIPDRSRADLDEYLTVAAALLRGEPVAPLGFGDSSRIADLAASCSTAAGIRDVELFGATRPIDFSQCEPRGHYTRSDALSHYFRAMMWLGRVDFRPIATDPSGAQQKQRRDLDDVVAFRMLFDARSLELEAALDTAISLFVGMHDNMSLPDVDRYLTAIGSSPSGFFRRPDDEVFATFTRGRFGRQRILGDVMYKLPGTAELPLDASFALFGQRYAIDSHVLHAVTEDRVPGRELPDPLDVAFAALGNNQAARLLPELAGYSGQLATMRTLADAQVERYWTSSLYPAWLWALRALSPPEGQHARMQLPPVARTEAWGKRLLSTQLASWSELRHNTILYAQQSYSTFAICQFPDVYVDPYPELYRRLREAGKLGLRVARQLESVLPKAKVPTVIAGAGHYFDRFDEILAQLQEIAERELDGKPLSSAQMDFVNHMIRRQSHPGDSCGGGGGYVTYDGWYVDLLNGSTVEDRDPTVADVHTSSTGILHVGKGPPRQIVVIVDFAPGPRAYVGTAYSFQQNVQSTRSTDEIWEREVGGLPDVPWMADLVVRHP